MLHWNDGSGRIQGEDADSSEISVLERMKHSMNEYEAMRVMRAGYRNPVFRTVSIVFLTILIVSAWNSTVEGVKESASDEADVHEALYRSDDSLVYPSASECKQCHPDHYREWSVSPHAYAQMSPVFNAMHATILKITNGSNGDFCIRCHTPVGMNIGESVFMSNIDRHPTSREGVTCIVCHRVEVPYGKISGRVALNDGPLGQAIFGPKGVEDFDEKFGKEITEKFGEGKVHSEAKPFFRLVEPAFCGTCHDVNLLNGFRLEEAFSEYKMSPASRNGVSCNDCHMGVKPGEFTGDPETNYESKRIAKVGARWVGEPRRKTNHMFVGPDHSVIHPGIFPHNDTAATFADIREWLAFNYQEGWGTELFEEEEEPEREDRGEPTLFVDRWTNIDERYDAGDILADQFDLLEEYHAERLKVLQAGFGLGEIVVTKATTKGVKFFVEVKNLTDGHSVPTGFVAERVVYLQVTVKDEQGDVVYVSGDLDPNFDVRDLHSLFVHNHELPLDKDLFSLQSRFLTRNVRGSEREQVLALNFSPSPLPFLRPSRFSATLTGRPGGARIHKKNIVPLGARRGEYSIKGKNLTGQGMYFVNVKLVLGMVPVNLVNEIKGVGFDYGMSAHEVAISVRFGVGDVVNGDGERFPRAHVERLVLEEDYAKLADLYGVAGGHVVISEVDFAFLVGETGKN